ncbi:mannose-1-phosphate guanylyltransferase/mannose-6-phosphate isomerase [Rhodovulum visakhapatnamense]|uniref:mannose-1-phosphate guanylyltransferase n=1 Tax=Rhodovulum visakhapatnamense TaxID=364297 RepID=A0A4R8F0J6_9RHOB|nr:mannose-1-phosphate guanylyltransferase/mannose-6-phosphate isomerase [Rhodovulum visakhapatnamense]TDX18416.1 mannose-1-phosphate guanylyltransferase/mannose-1-phosphate guanylyltransferase/mannose-6-phosphate isomerase [Rhodovulum visakhapatnamense]
MPDLHPVILCGGSGTRLWPASRKAYPKQFAPLLGQDSLYQTTLRRFSAEGFTAPLVMTGDEFRFMATDQAAAIGLADARVVVEPCPRDSAPAILAAALLLEGTPDDLMLVAPSDHVITDAPAFLDAVRAGTAAALEGALVTFGVTPDRPETGYGYLELAAPPGKDPVPVVQFREKPDQATAEAFLAAGTYLWNGGIFLGRVRDVIAAFETHAPQMVPPCRAAIAGGAEDLGFFRLAETPFAGIEPISFDYAVMEKAAKVAAVPIDCGWSDLGAWDALWKIAGHDENGVALVGDAVAVACEDSYLRSEEEGVVLVGLGLKDVVAVAMRDAVLVADKSRAQDVKKVVETLRRAKAVQADHYPRYHRPWGWYETLCLGARFQVKRIMVKPDGVLSLQSHHHRSEHWIVVAGTAEVTIGEEKKLVTENQSVYIPLGTVHRMANPGKLPMYLIEVQTGAYLGEDDIVRYEDIYNRS